MDTAAVLNRPLLVDDWQEASASSRTVYAINAIAGLTLLLLSVSGVGGLITGKSLGAAMIGLGAGCYLLSLSTTLKQHKAMQITAGGLTLLAIVLGALGCSGTLSAMQLGWGSIGLGLGGSALMSLISKQAPAVPKAIHVVPAAIGGGILDLV